MDHKRSTLQSIICAEFDDLREILGADAKVDETV
jgi:hypothetical protein